MKNLPMAFVSAAFYLFFSYTPANAASFYCDHRIDNDIDKAICASNQLSELDELLYDVYKTSIEHPGGSYDVDSLKQEQRHWVRDSRNKCRKAKSIADCLVPIYESRIDELLLKGPVPADRKLRITQASGHYDFQLEFVNIKSADEGADRFGRVAVYEKGSIKPLQYIPMKQIYIAVDEENQILTNNAEMYGMQGTINVSDFNFDGEEDVAIRNGNNGSYGGPSYDVFLFSKKQSKFIKSPALSDLIESTLGMFDIHPDKRRLSTWEKSGCCWHQYTEYELRKNIPVAVYRMTEEPERVDADDFMFVQTHEALRNGKWETIKTDRVPPE